MKDELVSPGILGLAAAAAPFGLAFRVWWIHTYDDPRPELNFLAIPFVFFFIVLGLVVTFFAARLPRSTIGAEYRVNGGVVLAGSLLSGMFVIPSTFRIPNLTEGLIVAGFFLSSSLGVVGGLKGIYWERSWRDGAAVPDLAEYSRWALIGGLVLLLVAPWFYPDPLTVLGSFIVPVSGALVYKGKGNRRILGLAIMAGALLAGNPFWLYTRLNPGVTTLQILGLSGTILSIIAGVKILTSKATRPNGS